VSGLLTWVSIKQQHSRTWAQQLRDLRLQPAVVEPRARLAAQILDEVVAIALGHAGMLCRGLQPSTT